MIVFIPIRSTECLDKRVEKSILGQTTSADIKLIENIPISTNGRKSEHEARDAIKSYAQNSTDKYLITNDSDTMQLYADNFQCMIDLMDKQTDIGAVALWSGENKIHHIRPQCCLWKREVLANICQLTVEGANHKMCCCDRYKESVEKQGFKMVYLDLLKRIRIV